MSRSSVFDLSAQLHFPKFTAREIRTLLLFMRDHKRYPSSASALSISFAFANLSSSSGMEPYHSLPIFTHGILNAEYWSLARAQRHVSTTKSNKNLPNPHSRQSDDSSSKTGEITTYRLGIFPKVTAQVTSFSSHSWWELVNTGVRCSWSDLAQLNGRQDLGWITVAGKT